jgi:hypothetical protein
MAFTLDSDTSTPRTILLLMTVLFAVYELFIHEYPNTPTVIDFLYDKLPLFTQRKFLRRALIIWIAIVRCYFDKKKT